MTKKQLMVFGLGLVGLAACGPAPLEQDGSPNPSTLPQLDEDPSLPSPREHGLDSPDRDINLSAQTTVCQVVEGRQWPDTDAKTGTLPSSMPYCEDLMSYSVWADWQKEYTSEEDTGGGGGTTRSTNQGAMAAVAATVGALRARMPALSPDHDDICQALCDVLGDCSGTKMLAPPPIGDEPDLLCGTSGGEDAPFDCGDTQMVYALNTAVKDLIDPYWDLNSSEFGWVAFDFDESAKIPASKSRLIWLPILRALHLNGPTSPPGSEAGSPVALYFENSDGYAAMAVLEVHYTVQGEAWAVDAFNSYVSDPEVTTISPKVMGAINLEVPTFIRYRQGQEIRVWPTDRPIMDDGVEAGLTWMQFLDTFAIIDPYSYAVDEEMGTVTTFGGATNVSTMYALMSEASKADLLPGETQVKCP